MKQRLHILLILLCLGLSVRGADTTKPWTFWYWMYGAVSAEGIRADLQAMKDVGLGGCYLMPIRGAVERPEFGGQADALSDNFWHLVDQALVQADSLGLGMGIHVCDGFALAGGPWITPAESMQKVVFCDTIISGGHQQFRMSKPQHYEDYYEDISAYAIPLSFIGTPPSRVGTSPFRVGSSPSRTGSSSLLSCTSRMLRGLTGTLSYSPEVTINDKGVYCANDPCWLQYAFEQPTMVRTVEIEPSGTNIQCQRLLVKASDDGVVFYPVKQLTPPRQGWQNTGFNTTFSIPPTTAKYFRFEWTPAGTEPGAEDLDAAKWKAVLRLKSLKLGALPTIDNWEGKAGFVWRIAPDTPAKDLASDDYISPDKTIRFQMKGDQVDIELPKGQWRILRMGHTSTGHTNATAGGAKGLECDKFSKETVGKQIDSWFGLFMNRPHHKAIQYMHVDSWECGSQNWSKNFAQEFQHRRGYDLLPLLPVYAGVPMKDAEKVLRDIRQTIDELINEVFFVTVAQKAKEYGVKLSSESVAPTMVSDGLTHYQYVDVPMGEYWLNSPTHDKPNDMLDAISGAHVYGKNIVQAEGFTEVRGVWDETPAMVKPLLDRNFALGMNRLFFHVNTHNPWLDKKPGMTLDGIGLFFQRDQTWFPEARAMVDYITRCQTLLQQGQPVVDIAVYTGEEMPRRSWTPDRLVSMLPGLFGAERVASEKARLENIGQPMVESPVGVRHAAGIIDLKDWVNCLHGYQYDSMNKDALLTRPFHYKALVVPPDILISEEVKAKIEELRKQGVLIIDKPYSKFQLEGITPDIVLPEGIAYCHRQSKDQDIYFLSNQQDQHVSCKPVFRNKRNHVVVFRPQTNEYEAFENGFIELAPYESCFVLFEDTDRWNDSKKAKSADCITKPLNIKDWTISFRESGIQLEHQQLFDWSKSDNDKVKYFSGHARYSTDVKLKKKEVPAGRAWLTLPHVKDVAHVWINGQDCGIAWTAPYEVEITGLLQKGKNRIEIEVVNTWHNALRGMDQGKAPYEGIWTNAKYRTKGEELLPAGLLSIPEIKTEIHE